MSERLPSPAAPAGWYPDPDDPSDNRWWNGAAWAEPGEGPLDRDVSPPLETFTDQTAAGTACVPDSFVYQPSASDAFAAMYPQMPFPGMFGARSGRSRTRLILLLVVAVIVLAGMLAAVGALMAGSANLLNEAVNPNRNAQTGLPDGTYSMQADRFASVNGRCVYGGPAVLAGGAASPADVTVVGMDAAECPAAGGMPGTVTFVVDGGLARVLAG